MREAMTPCRTTHGPAMFVSWPMPMERAVILSRTDSLLPVDLPPSLSQVRPGGATELKSLEIHEREYILYVVSQLSGNLEPGAAKILGLDRTTLWREARKRFGIAADEKRAALRVTLSRLPCPDGFPIILCAGTVATGDMMLRLRLHVPWY